MSLAITFAQDSLTPLIWSLSADAQASLELWRLALTELVTITRYDANSVAYTTLDPMPKYLTIKDMLAGELRRVVVDPAFALNLPSSVATEAATLATAQAAFDAALLAAKTGAVAETVRNLWTHTVNMYQAGNFNTDDVRWGGWTWPSALDGGNQAVKLIETAQGGTPPHWYRIYADHGTGQQTLSFHFKAAEQSWVYITSQTEAGVGRVWFHLSGGGSVGTMSLYPSGATAAITSLASGWYRCSVTYTPASYAIWNGVGLALSDNEHDHAGTDGVGIYQWGQQYERGTLTDYQPIA